jgi:hypothetical protein
MEGRGLMGRPKSKGAYVPLAAQYYLDDAILEAGSDAELLFVRMLSFLAAVPSDGFITDRQVPIVAAGLRAPRRRLDALLNVGLIEQVSGGFLVRSWLKWNRSADEVGKLLAKDRERKARKDAEDAPNSARNPEGIRSDSELQSRAEQSSTEQSIPPSDADASDSAGFDAEVIRLCEVLAEGVRANGHKVGTVGKQWHLACERLMRLDNYTPTQIEWLIHWTMRDEFWAANIRSMSKFREKFSTLKAQAQKHPNGRGQQQSFVEKREMTALERVAEQEREEARHEGFGDDEADGLRRVS